MRRGTWPVTRPVWQRDHVGSVAVGGPDIEISEHASDADIAELRDALVQHNVAATGYRDGQHLSCFLREDGRLVAGIDGHTWGGYAHVDVLWVDESRRGQGLGRALLAAAEAEARRRGCTTIVLDTPRGHSQIYFQKAL